MEFKGARRFLEDQWGLYDRYINAAAEYPVKVGEYIPAKPFGHATGYLKYMYNALDIIQSMSLPPGSRILDVGAGPGCMTEILMSLNYVVDAVEPSDIYASQLKRRIESFSAHIKANQLGWDKNVSVYNCSIEEYECPAGIYDAIMFVDALHHVVDENKALEKCFKALKKGGMICIHEGAWQPGNTGLEDALKQEMEAHGTLENPFSVQYLDHILRKSGFYQINRYYGISRIFPFASSYKPSNFFDNYIREDDCNFVVARRPWDMECDKYGEDVTNGRLKVAAWSIEGKSLVIDVDLQNTGNTVWYFDPLVQAGYLITVAVFNKEDKTEIGRRVINQIVVPGEMLSMELVFDLEMSVFSATDWCLDMINEGVSWFELNVPLCEGR